MGAYNDTPYSCNIEKLKLTNIHSVFILALSKARNGLCGRIS